MSKDALTQFSFISVQASVLWFVHLSSCVFCAASTYILEGIDSAPVLRTAMLLKGPPSPLMRCPGRRSSVPAGERTSNRCSLGSWSILLTTETVSTSLNTDQQGRDIPCTSSLRSGECVPLYHLGSRFSSNASPARHMEPSINTLKR
jgi:hypothetical protein